MSKKKNIWKILGMAGMIFGFLGTMMQGYAEDKDLDARIDEAVEKKLNESHHALMLPCSNGYGSRLDA